MQVQTNVLVFSKHVEGPKKNNERRKGNRNQERNACGKGLLGFGWLPQTQKAFTTTSKLSALSFSLRLLPPLQRSVQFRCMHSQNSISGWSHEYIFLMIWERDSDAQRSIFHRSNTNGLCVGPCNKLVCLFAQEPRSGTTRCS